jgi:hypothetical protein
MQKPFLFTFLPPRAPWGRSAPAKTRNAGNFEEITGRRTDSVTFPPI